MNDDLVVQKILKLLENNTAFIGYALNGGIGTKINVRNTETGKTIQALSINVDSTGEVLVVKDSEDNQFKAVTFKTAEKVSERIIQLRKTKPVDDKKTIEYTDSDIEVFYLFVKLIDTGSPVPSQLTSTWIRKGSSCTQFVGAYERCNYASRATIGGVSYTGLPYIEYPTLQDCLNDDSGRDAATPHGTSDENGLSLGVRIYSTKMTATAEQNLLGALTSHDNHYGTNMKKLFGYGSILECGGAMYVNGWESVFDTVKSEYFFRCDFGYFPGYDNRCTSAMEDANYCRANGGYINSKTPLFGQEAPGQPSVGAVDNSLGHEMGWVDLPYDFFYQQHFIPLYVNGAGAQGSFLIISGLNADQNPTIPEGFFPWVPGCPANGQGGPYDGSGGNRFPDGVPPIKKRDMKLSTHKAEIWLGSSKKTEAIKLYELGASDLFSGMYNAFIKAANESDVDLKQRLNSNYELTQEDLFRHQKFYENRDKNIIDLRLDPRVWIYIINNVPNANYTRPSIEPNDFDPPNPNLQLMIDNLYMRTVNLTVVDKNTQIVHFKLGLKPANVLSNTDCKGSPNGFVQGFPLNNFTAGQSWEYQKYKTIKIKNWQIESTTNTLNTSDLGESWNKDYINRKFFTSFGSLVESGIIGTVKRDSPNNILLQHNSNVSLVELASGNHYEQYNYSHAKLITSGTIYTGGSEARYLYPNSSSYIVKPTNYNERERYVLRSTSDWWALWGRTILDPINKRLNSVVGYSFNSYQILTSYKLSPTLDYTSQTFNNQQVGYETYYEYLPERDLLYTPSAIKTARDKLIPGETGGGSILNALSTRQDILNNFGLNHFHVFQPNTWTNQVIIPPYIYPPSNYYGNFAYANQTREMSLLSYTKTGNNVSSNIRRLDTRRWDNRLWVQLISDKFLTVDIDSCKDVQFNFPINPTKYIKYTTNQETANSEYSFILNKDQTLETVISAGVQDITKQVKMTKPTNVDLDPNYSFLVYIYPFVEVTKKKKII